MSAAATKNEMKIGLVMDDYKLKNKEKWWNKALSTMPHIKKEFDLVKEEQVPGISKGTTSVIRYYKRKEPKK